MRHWHKGAALLVVAIAIAAAFWWQHATSQAAASTPVSAAAPTVATEYYRDVKHIFDNRCLVCHGCYDAPCQLKLDSPEGVQRGATQAKVYDGTRLLAAEPTRLFIDAQTTPQWRAKDFYPVLNEGAQNPTANLAGSVLYQMLALKQKHPLPDELPDDIDVSLARKEFCPNLETFPKYAREHPLQGMPFALPALDAEEFATVKRWLQGGAKVAAPAPLDDTLQENVKNWEHFLNGDDLKTQLMSRYLYEHLFLADLYFDASEPRHFFKLVRSRTPPGEALDVIATRRPFDDPGVARVYYRLQWVTATIVAKTHIPYALTHERMARYRELFLQTEYALDALPTYEPEVGANPFVAFAAIPVHSRYRFMLDDAGFFIESFIKGPVCRGQIALNVIDDQFWVVFANPENSAMVDGDFLAKESGNLRLPSEIKNEPLAFTHWKNYGGLQQDYLSAKERFLQQKYGTPRAVTLNLLWNGDGNNKNAALTVFRHFDSASVVQGLVGEVPKTAWVIDYPMLERIYYLLVAGFDVYGDVSHQLLTRLYMDFLRMEGEINFLDFLPKAMREKERNSWYQGVGAKLLDSVYRRVSDYQRESGVQYHTKNPKREFFDQLRSYLGPALAHRYDLEQADLTPSLRAALQDLAKVRGQAVAQIPEVIFLRVVILGAPDKVFTLIHNADHSNVTVLFLEDARRRPQFDTLTVVPGIIGAYPNAFWLVNESELPQLVKQLAALDGPEAYRALQKKFAVARTSEKFWQQSDWLHTTYRESEPIEWGVFDYNRYEK